MKIFRKMWKIIVIFGFFILVSITENDALPDIIRIGKKKPSKFIIYQLFPLLFWLIWWNLLIFRQKIMFCQFGILIIYDLWCWRRRRYIFIVHDIKLYGAFFSRFTINFLPIVVFFVNTIVYQFLLGICHVNIALKFIFRWLDIIILIKIRFSR